MSAREKGRYVLLFLMGVIFLVMVILECRMLQELGQDLMHTRPECHLMRYILHDLHDTSATVDANSSCFTNAKNVNS